MSQTTTDYPKKLIEVSIPLKEINEASAREKSIRHGHPSTLHLWWARRPLAAARAVLFCQLVDDPSGYVDELVADKVRRKRAEQQIAEELKMAPHVSEKVEDVLVQRERDRLHGIVKELVLWENTNNEKVLNKARKEIKKSWARTCRREGKPEDTPMPPFLDPFAGGGAIPLEAQRLGLESHASDLNPVAVLINKAMIEIPPKFADMPPVHPQARKELGTTGWQGAAGLAEDVRRYGKWMSEEASKRIGHLYASYKLTEDLIRNRSDLQGDGYQDGDELTVLAYLWARTVPSPNPAMNGRHVPLLSTFELSTKAGSKAWLEPWVEEDQFGFEVRMSKPTSDTYRKTGTKASGKGANFYCILSGAPISSSYVRECASNGKMDHVKVATVCIGRRKRIFLPADVEPEIPLVPEDFLANVKIATISGYLNPPLYGFDNLRSFFNSRQLTSLKVFSDLVAEVVLNLSNNDVDEEYIEAIATYLTLGVGRLENRLSTFSIWNKVGLKIEQTFSEQGVGMTWDYAEANPFSGASGSWDGAISWIPKCLEKFPNTDRGFAWNQDGADAFEIAERTPIVSTDPPYYSSITYADFADFFYGVFRNALREIFPELFSTIATPKASEAVAAWHRFENSREKAGIHFQEKLSAVIGNMSQICSVNFPVTIYYAFKEKEFQEGFSKSFTAWESILTVLLDNGFAIDATWPIRTERTTGRKARKNVLATSVILSCRKKPSDAPAARRRDFVKALKEELPSALKSLQGSFLAPVDLPQSSIGPGMSIFSRYSAVVDDDGSEMKIRNALQLINEALDDFLSEQEAQMDEWTRFAVSWFSQHSFGIGSYGDAQNIATARNVSVEGVAEAGILETGRQKVRILRPSELPTDWDPETDNRLTVWEIVHHLIRILKSGGEDEAAKVLKAAGSRAYDAKALCYRLFNICEQNSWADEGRDYNLLMTEWSRLQDRADQLRGTKMEQDEMFE